MSEVNSVTHECWTIGDNEMGQQAIETDEDEVESLTLIREINKMSNINICNILTGAFGSTYLLCNDNRMIVFGNDEAGQLGIFYHFIQLIVAFWCRMDSIVIPSEIMVLIITFVPKLKWSENERRKPILIDEFPIKYISYGTYANHRFIITTNNQIYAAGCGVDHIIYHDIDRRNQCDENTKFNTWRRIDFFKEYKIKIKEIHCLYGHSLFLTMNGTIYRAGEDDNFSILSLDEEIKSICCGQYHSLALTVNNSIYSWGWNNRGQLGLGYKNEFQFECNDYYGKLYKIPYFETNKMEIIQIASGDSHNIILTKDNTIYCWGKNQCYECGTGYNKKKDVVIPELNHRLRKKKIIDIKCGAFHNVVKTDDNKFYLWGSNDYNQCLVDEDEEFISKPTRYDDEFFTKQNKKILAIYPGFNETRVVVVQLYCVSQ